MITINLPLIIRVSDYHELDEVRDTINKLSPSEKVKTRELGFDGQYIGILYTGSYKNQQEFIKSQWVNNAKNKA